MLRLINREEFVANVGLNGFMRMTSPQIRTDFYYWGYPFGGSQLDLFGETTSPDYFAQGWAQLGITPDPARGMVNAVPYSCPSLGGDQSGIRVTINSADSATRSFSVPAFVETDVTDSAGDLVFINVPAGDIVVTAIPLAIGKPSSVVSAHVQAGASTSVLLFPTP